MRVLPVPTIIAEDENALVLAPFFLTSRLPMDFSRSSRRISSLRRDDPLRTITSCRMMRVMSDSVRPTMTSSTVFVISITETTKITVPAGPEGRD
jgi:hypothetical protein